MKFLIVVVVVIGVLGRLASDFGLQFGEYTVFQQETQIFPRLNTSSAFSSQGYFDFDNTFINGLPDDYHLQFVLKLPAGMPPSIQLATPSANQPEVWGLSYYLFAYVTSGSAVESMLSDQMEGHLFWDKLRSGKRQSKTFLSFSKILIHDRERLTDSPSYGEATKTSFLSSEPCLWASAQLDQPAYRYGDAMNVRVNITNPKRIKISGIRINVKQLLSIKIGGDPKSVIKSCIARYSFSNNRDEIYQNEDGYHNRLSSLKDVETFCDNLKIRPHIDPLRFIYQLALTTTLPRSEQSPPILAANINFNGEQWALGGGLERIRLLSVEYYMNVHVVIPWGTNLIIKLPFRMVNLDDGGRPSIPRPIDSLDSPIFTIPPPPQNTNRATRPKQNVFEQIKDLRPVPNNLIVLGEEQKSPSLSPIFEDRVESNNSTPKTQSNHSQRSPKGNVEIPYGISSASSLKDDVLQARSLLSQLRTKLSSEQRIMLKNPLDSKSMSLHFDQRREVLVKEFLAIMEEVLVIWIPRLSKEVTTLRLIKSTGDLALFDPIDEGISGLSIEDSAQEHITARCLVQNFCGRLGMFHSQLAQFQSPKTLQEENMEFLNTVIDDLDLVLARLSLGLSGKVDDAGHQVSVDSIRDLLTRIQKKSLALIDVIPFYFKFDEELRRLQNNISEYSWIDGTNSNKRLVSNWGLDFDDVIGKMASQFEGLSSYVVSTIASGATLLEKFREYIDTLIVLHAQVPTLSDRMGVIVFWQWHYLHTVVDTYYNGGTESPLLLADRNKLAWNVRILSLIPAQWDAINGKGDPSNRLILVGNRVIAAMQQLVDTKPS